MSNAPPLWRTFLVFLAPMMLSNILQSLFGTINNVYLANARRTIHVLRHVPSAGELLPSGLAQARGQAVTGISQRHSIMVVIMQWTRRARCATMI